MSEAATTIVLGLGSLVAVGVAAVVFFYWKAKGKQ